MFIIIFHSHFKLYIYIYIQTFIVIKKIIKKINNTSRKYKTKIFFTLKLNKFIYILNCIVELSIQDIIIIT